MADYKGFPVLVKGSWGPDPPRNLSTKLQLYFQSPKKSGGGKCKVHQEPGSPPCFVVVFLLDDVRQRVLMRGNHELVLPGKRMFKLTLKLLSASEKAQEAAERETPRDGSRVKCTTKQPERKNGEDPRRCRSGSRITLQGTKTVVTTITKATGAHNYRNNSLERQKRKDRGEESQGAQKKRKIWCKVDASEELDTALSVYKASENVEAVPDEHESLFPSVAFENLTDSVTDVLLTLLVENISCLSSDDFEVEVIRDLDLAVVTFKKYIDIMKFVEKCAKHPKVKRLQLSARVLEMTKTIRIENLPPGVDAHDLKIFFENPQNGGGRVANVECLPEESSALVEFLDRRALDSIMAKKLDLNHMPLSVFPYYHSLDTALYGKEKPLIKLPAPFKETLDLPIWKFLQKNTHLVEEITEEVKRCHCELAWSQLNGEVTFTPSASLVSQGRKKIKSWQKDTSRAFSEVRSKYKVISFKVDPLVWDTMKNALDDNRFLIDFDALMEILNVVGKSEDIENFEPQVKQLIESSRQRIEREQQSVKEKVSVSPGKYSLLCHSGVLEHLSSECPEVEMSYDEATQNMCFEGLPAGVYRVKCGILEKVFTMAQKNLQVSPEIFQFLKETDYAEFSKSLFTAQNILAVYELEAASVLLTSCSPEALLEAEKKMVGALSFKRIDVEDNKVLSDKNWKTLTSHLWSKHNSSWKTVLISQSSSESTAEVIVAGCVREVNEVYESLSEFLERHTQIELLVEVRPVLVLHYIENEMKALWQKVKKVNMRVIFDHEHNPKGFSLSGPITEVLKAVELVTKARDTLCVKKIQTDESGIKQFSQENQICYGNEVEKRFSYYVELVEKETKAGSGSHGQKFFFSTTLLSGVSLIVQQGDLTQFPVGVVVNSANEELKHGGGLAATLLKAAGPELQEDCDQIVKAKGKIPPGSATISKAGRLPYTHVIHAVGPEWNQHEAHKCVGLLKQAVKESLRLAEEHKYHSIAIPAICSGDHGFPLPQCVETIVLTIRENFQQKSDGHSLKEIYLVDAAEKTVEAFAEAVKMPLKGIQPDSTSLPSLPVTNQTNIRNDNGNRGILSTPEGLGVQLVRGDVQNAVAFTDEFAQRTNGNFSSDKIFQSEDSQGFLSIVPTSTTSMLRSTGPKLPPSQPHVCLGATSEDPHLCNDSWGQPPPPPQQLLQSQLQLPSVPLQSPQLLSQPIPYIQPQLQSLLPLMSLPQQLVPSHLQPLPMTSSSSPQSLMYPGAQNQDYYHFRDAWEQPVPTPQLSMCFGAQNQNYYHYRDAWGQSLLVPPLPTPPPSLPLMTQLPPPGSLAVPSQYHPGFYGAVYSRYKNVFEMSIGSITYHVTPGNIIYEMADVIVNSTSRTFDRKVGVSKAIFEGAGKHVEMQCWWQALQGSHDYIVTDGGSLMCKNIIHVIGDNDVKKSVTSVLQECEQRYYSSVCLPAIGTGRAKQNPEKVAEAIMDAIKDFDQQRFTQYVKTVKVVIFYTPLLNEFYNEMKKRGGCLNSYHQSMTSKTSFEIPVHWSDMGQQKVLVMPLHPADPEYIIVADKFKQTCADFTIEKIERIQNTHLWNFYQTQKRAMDDKNGQIGASQKWSNEKHLFHGTHADSVPQINTNGFNRSYNAKNGKVYGKGTYFAVNANYSANDVYSRPDMNGKKHMYYARVLTGLYTTGRQSFIEPPKKDPKYSTDLYDTVTDNVQKPKVFVVFHDYQAYPEYLITFRK